MAADKNRAAWIRGGIVAGAILAISGMHYITPPGLVSWHYILQRLFYLPVIYAALHFGWRGGIATAVFAWIFYFPFLVSWRELPHYLLSQYVEVIVFCLAGILTGILADRGRKDREMLQRRTDELSAIYRELQENFERMKRADRLSALGQLAAGLAHEIRNPLASIAGATSILRRNPAPDQRHAECVEIITRECERLNRLLTNFLDFARPQPPRYQETDLGRVLDAVIDLSAHATIDRPTTLRKELAPDLPPLSSDPERLKQVLLNLIINAIQAMPGGGVVVLSAKAHDGTALIQVKDEGSGISAENLDRIFDPFFTTKQTGAGLGLSVAHQIVGQLGGVLTADANPDRGMTFSVRLPIDRRRAM